MLPMSHRVVFGTRPSAMAQQMAHFARQQLVAAYPELEVEVKTFSSTGDKNQGDLSKVGGKGAFVKDLELRLLDGEIDCAIHALKDVPGDIDPHPDLELACYLEREDPRDALIMRAGLGVPTTGEGLVLATSSPRRQAFLRRLYPLASVIPLRGNVDSRLKKLQAGEFDGMVLAKSGLERLNLTQHITHVYETEEMLPAVSQGILSLQVRKRDVARCSFLSAINNGTTSRIVAAERRMLRVLEGNCYAAIAGHCTEEGDQRRLRAWVSNPQGTEFIQAEMFQPLEANPADLGETIARDLLNRGARRLISAPPNS